ncbi:MAG: hypothetical protein H7Z42_08475 [Roseiflexaceae bacterium]|nr:hypothetical protein [Roseiflexaceae bacterium]
MNKFAFVILSILVTASSLMPANAQEPTPPPPPLDISSVAALDRQDFIGMVVRDPFYEWNSNPAFPQASNKDFLDQMGQVLAKSGVQWVRFEVHLGSAFESDLAAHDYFINEVAPRHKLKVLALLGFDLLRGRSVWELEKGPFLYNRRFGGGVNGYMEQWLDRALRVADRYKGNIHAYELLNEQNRMPAGEQGQDGQKDIPAGAGIPPSIVGRLVTKFFRLCHNLDTLAEEPRHSCGEAQIVLGGLHPRGTSDREKPSTIALTDEAYLRAIYGDASSFEGFKSAYKCTPACYPVDGIAYHPYPEEVRLSPNYARQVQVDTGVDRMLKVMAEFDPGKQLWITEIGYNVAFYRNSPAELGAFMADIYTTLAARPEIANVFWFKYEDFAPWESDPERETEAQKWGIVRIPFEEAAGRPDGTLYQANGVPSEFRDSYHVLRALSGVPLGPIKLYFPQASQ